MSVVFINDLSKVDAKELNSLYDDERDYYELFERSMYKVFALENNSLVGAVRVLSEGVETALLVDLSVKDKARLDIKQGLVKEIETFLIDRRVMVYADRENLDFYEDLGYGRCKNAWTYYKDGFREADFLPPGYRYENEFIKYSAATVNPPKNATIVYEEGYANACYHDINELLTKAFFGRPHELERTTEAFQNSQFVVTAYDGDKLVGIARAVSDSLKYATILNVAVDPEYQGLSIGKKVVLKLSEITTAETIVLNTHPGAIGFYNRLSEYRRNKYVFEKMITTDETRKMDPERMGAMFTPKGYKFPDEY